MGHPVQERLWLTWSNSQLRSNWETQPWPRLTIAHCRRDIPPQTSLAFFSLEICVKRKLHWIGKDCDNLISIRRTIKIIMGLGPKYIIKPTTQTKVHMYTHFRIASIWKFKIFLHTVWNNHLAFLPEKTSYHSFHLPNLFALLSRISITPWAARAWPRSPCPRRCSPWPWTSTPPVFPGAPLGRWPSAIDDWFICDRL